MDKRAFFFQGDSLLMPESCQEQNIENCFNSGAGLPLELSNEFNADDIDIFEIPAFDNLSSIITVASIAKEASLPGNWKKLPVRQLLSMSASGGVTFSANINRIIRACHIAQWRGDSRFCGTCGAENKDVSVQIQRVCPRCGRNEFPRICPAVIVLITDDENRILLAHNKHFKEGLYSHVSGFNEAGETLEETAAREIKEEVNVEVKDISYIKSQPWPFPNSLMLGFRAKYASGIIQPDGEEIEDAKWFTKDNMPVLPGEGSLSRYLIERWLNGSY